MATKRKSNAGVSVLPSSWTPGSFRVTKDGKIQVKVNPSRIRTRKNESVAMGFYDKSGRFHPIRSSDDYDPEAVGERSQYARAKKKRRKR